MPISSPGTGSVAIVRQPDGSYVVRFSSDFSASGEGLVVYLSQLRGELTDANVIAAGRIELGPLQSTTGAQDYLIPAGTDPTTWGSVIVWSTTSNTGVTGASINPL